MANNIFLAGASKKAAFSWSDPSLVGLPLQLELYMSKDGGVTKTTTTGPQNFTAAASNPFSLTIAMPTATGDYQAFITVSYNGTIIEGFQDINTEIIPSGSFTPITWS